jgi:hypothetical protein
LKESSSTTAAFSRAGRRAVYHLLQAAIEGLKAIEAVIEEIGTLGDESVQDDGAQAGRRIEVE